jgi:hypothetical protein
MVSPGMFLRKPPQHNELDGCHGNHARRFIVTASPERPPPECNQYAGHPQTLHPGHLR